MAHYAFIDENNIVTEVIVGRYDPPATVGADTVIVFKGGAGTVTWN